MDPLTAGIVSAGIGGVSNIAGSLLSSRSARKQQSAQNAFNLQMWNLNNAYNAPVNQIARLKQAGLNPNLLYGNGSIATGNSSYTPQQNAYLDSSAADSARIFGESVGQAFDNYFNYAQRKKTLDNADLTNQNLRDQNKILTKQAEMLECQKREV